jgi:tetratricopeptide (TPR) repeat protein
MRKFYILWVVLTTLLCVGCENPSEKRKIRLSADDDTITPARPHSTTTIQLEPKERRSIAVLYFKNKTGDENLGWLQKGLTEMFIRALAQSNSISILSTDRLFEILKRVDKEKSSNFNINLAALIAQEANVEVLVTGSIAKSGDSLRLSVKLHEPQQGMIFKEEAIEGQGLEDLFRMVDNLTSRIKDDLLLTPGKEAPTKGIAELSSNSLEAWRHYTSGIEAKNKFLWNDALSALNHALENDSTFIGAYLELAMVHLSLEQRETSYAAFQKAKLLKEKATPPEIFRIEWFEALFNNDFQKLVDINHAWIQQYPDDRDANQNIANFYYGQQNFRAALEYNQKVLQIDNKNTMALNQLGYTYANLGQFDQAVEIMERYQKITTDEPNPFDSSGDIYLLAGEFEKAEKNYRKALEIRNDFFASWLNLAGIYLQQGEYDKSLEATNQYLKFADDRNVKIPGYLHQAAVYWRQKNYPKALDLYRQVLEINPLNAQIIQRISEIHQMHGDTTAVRKNLEEYYFLIRQQLDSSVHSYQAVITLFQLSLWNGVRIEESIRLLEKFLEENPAKKVLQVQTRFLLAVLYLKNQQLSQFEGVWRDIQPAEILQVLREFNNFSFTNLWSNYVFVNKYCQRYPDRGIRNYEKFIELSKESDLKIVESIYRMFLADLLIRTNQLAAAQSHLKMAGMPLENTWMVCGPYKNVNGFNQKFPPEKKIDLTGSFSGGVTWKTAVDSSLDGFINLKENIVTSNWAVGYGLIYLDAPEAQPVQFRVGSNEAIKIWLNDREVWKMNAIRMAVVDSDIFEVNLHKGRNKILVKVCNSFGNWGFYFRVTDVTGNGIPALEFISAKQAATTALLD